MLGLTHDLEENPRSWVFGPIQAEVTPLYSLSPSLDVAAIRLICAERLGNHSDERN
jgi:hypothetical protein